MQIQKAYQLQLKVRSRQEQKLKRAAGCCRYVWNKALRLQKDRLDWNEPVLSNFTVDTVFTHWKQEHA